MPPHGLALPAGQAIVDRRAHAGADQEQRGGAEIEDSRPDDRDGDGAGHRGRLGKGGQPQSQDKQQRGAFMPDQKAMTGEPGAQRIAGLVQELHSQEQQPRAEEHQDGMSQPLGEIEVEVEQGSGDRQGIGDDRAGWQRHQDHQGRRPDLGPDRQEHGAGLRQDAGPHEADHDKRHRAGALGHHPGHEAGDTRAPIGPDRGPGEPPGRRAGQGGQIGGDEAHAAEEQPETSEQERQDAARGHSPTPLRRPARPGPAPPTQKPPGG